MNKKIIVISNEAWSLLSLRGELLKKMACYNLDVTTLSNSLNKDQFLKLKFIGVSSEAVKLSRNDFNLFNDLKYFFTLILKYRDKNPNIILAYTIKPVIWGGIASRFFKVDFYALITGLGFSFQGDSFRRKLLTKLVVFLYKVSLKKSQAVIFQNIDNRNTFIEKGIVELDKSYIVNGSGVDIEKFPVVDFPNRGSINFLCIARLLSEKGLREYASAAKIVKAQYPEVQFNLVGLSDSSPDAISLSEVNNWRDCINYKESNNIRLHIESCHVYVLPSYHEGLPRSSLEAMSMGRPIITTDSAGCKETVKDQINGFKVPVKSVDKLVEKMIWFIENNDQIKQMGLESRKIVENKFDIRKVNKKMLKILNIK